MDYLYYSTPRPVCQDCGGKILHDVTAFGRERPWEYNKKQSRKLSQLYRFVDESKAARMDACADWLGYVKDGEGFRLSKANFCRVRLCPMCQWRRSLKTFGQMARICDNVNWNDYAAIHLTLTVRNCNPSELSATLDRVLEGYHRLLKYKEVDKAVKGSYRALEITINSTTGDPWIGTMHPHIHALLIVRRSYFTSRDYIKQARWIELWRKACKLDYDPDVKLYKVYVRDGQTIHEALREVTKYTTKASDITETPLDPVEYIQTLDAALDKRRFVSYSGMLKDLHRSLNLTDPMDDGDLVNAGDLETGLSDAQKDEVYYIWRSGLYVEWNPEEIS